MPEGSAHSILDGLYDLHETVGTGGFAKVGWLLNFIRRKFFYVTYFTVIFLRSFDSSLCKGSNKYDERHKAQLLKQSIVIVEISPFSNLDSEKVVAKFGVRLSYRPNIRFLDTPSLPLLTILYMHFRQFSTKLAYIFRIGLG